MTKGVILDGGVRNGSMIVVTGGGILVTLGVQGESPIPETERADK